MNNFKVDDEFWSIWTTPSFGYEIDNRICYPIIVIILNTEDQYLGYVRVKSELFREGNITVSSLFKSKQEAIDAMIKRMQELKDE